jgi:hypothetical protein
MMIERFIAWGLDLHVKFPRREAAEIIAPRFVGLGGD